MASHRDASRSFPIMGGLSPIHWIIVLGVVAVLFGGGGKISSLMGDAAKGIRAFKDGLKNPDEPAAAPPAASQIVAPAAAERPREDAHN
jgi:sec-independent protein translocase protein TatA